MESAQEQQQVAATEVAALPNGAYKVTATRRLSDQISLVRRLKKAHDDETSRRGNCWLKYTTCGHDADFAKTLLTLDWRQQLQLLQQKSISESNSDTCRELQLRLTRCLQDCVRGRCLQYEYT